MRVIAINSAGRAGARRSALRRRQKGPHWRALAKGRRHMQVSKKMLALAGVAAVALAAAPAFAHHSFAMFDNQKNVTLEGTVKGIQWTTPHSWIQLVVKDASGKEVEYSIEGGSPN